MFIEALQSEEIETLVQLEHTLMTSPWSKEDFEYELLENPFAHVFVLKKDRLK